VGCWGGLEEAGLKEAGLENTHHNQTFKNPNVEGLPKPGHCVTFLGLRTVPPPRGPPKIEPRRRLQHTNQYG
jgi:hypothetical protein